MSAMPPSERDDAPLVATATRLETWAARIVLARGTTVRRVGVGLAAGADLPPGRPVISCGLAGALAPELRPGAVLIPEWVGLPSGERLSCDQALVAQLASAARRLGFVPMNGPLLTSPQLVTGNERAAWSARGYAAVDMETGLLLARCPRTAAVRVALDTPAAELSAQWERPTRILRTPRLWPQAMRIGLAAPAYALRAATIVRAALNVTMG